MAGFTGREENADEFRETERDRSRADTEQKRPGEQRGKASGDAAADLGDTVAEDAGREAATGADAVPKTARAGRFSSRCVRQYRRVLRREQRPPRIRRDESRSPHDADRRE
ncbi:hypothetical protein C482_06889 [Natrialba chahannaoensis JCM 10990]|uniref:Uncharacterized protein n=1 Tax=Natrialba chahannaoensis JCM 10990 TaxID=1227492 RepID=M0ASH0_9EURY|nr:hypothetical protein C482_06889 [Natrialba chahannaoensis JCM 10990]